MIAGDALYFVSSLLTGCAVAMGVDVALPIWDGLLRKRVGKLEETLIALGFDTSPLTLLLRLWCVALFTIPPAVWFGLKLGFVALPVAFVVWHSPMWIATVIIKKRKRLMRDQMIPLCVSLANSARSGLSLPQAMEEALGETRFPLRREVERIVSDYRRGRSIEEAIRDAQQRLKLDHFNVFASVILTCFESGSNYCFALDKMSQALMENQRLERKLESETAAGRSVVHILSAFPSVFLAMFWFLSPDMVTLLLWKPWGQVMIVVAACVNYAGVKVALKCMNVRI
ncbi:hypothetical protein GC170_12930 [bacterium]|nr:hypothetical protein [bacterium]